MPALSPQPRASAARAVILAKGDDEGGQCTTSSWTTKPLAGGVLHQFVGPDGSSCLSSAGAEVVPAPDDWCIANNNMWRSNTDVLQK